MRPLEHYVARVRAVAARPVAVCASIEADDGSAWWELTVLYEEPPQPVGTPWPWDRGSIDHHDELNGHVVLHAQAVLGRRYAEMRLAFPPDDIIVPKGRGAVEVERSHQPRDLEGRDRVCAEDLARTLAMALGVPAWIEADDTPYEPWWKRMEREARGPK